MDVGMAHQDLRPKCKAPSARRRCFAALVASASLAGVALASPEPIVTGEVPMADYLALLGQIAPAAHRGAQSYLQAHERRCRRSLGSHELRRAMAEGDGDPVLIAMIRASHLHDTQALARLGEQVRCTRSERR
jgi:hypothetical protein